MGEERAGRWAQALAFVLARLLEAQTSAAERPGLLIYTAPGGGVSVRYRGNEEGDPDGVVWDPRVVLADVAFKRALIKDYLTVPEPPTDDELHDRFGHPGWEYTTTQGQRKAWDQADDPPYGQGDGWELNVTARQPDAWERFEYTEERYWRRRRRRPGRPAEYVLPVPRTLAQVAACWAGHPEYRAEWAPL